MVDIFIKIDQKIRLFLRKYLLLIFFLAITIIAIYVRWICIEYESGDLQYYLDWYKQIKGNGGFQALKGQVGNYGEGYTLFLAVLTYLPVSPIYGIKLFSIVFDFVAAMAAGLIVNTIWKNRGQVSQLAPLLAYTAVLMLPTVILNSSYWGQCDTVYSAFCLLAILCVLREKFKLSFVMFGLALSIKMQAILLFPAWVLLWYKKKTLTLIHFLLIPGTYMIVCIPAIFAGKSLKTIFDLFSQFGSGAFGIPYQGLNNLSIFLLPNDPYIMGVMVKVSLWFTISLVGVSMLIWITRNVRFSNHLTFIALCLFYVLLATEFLGGLHERHAMLVDLISVVFFFAWGNVKGWFIPLILNAHSFLGYVRYCTNRWDVAAEEIYMTTFMVEAGAYFLFACWLMMFFYKRLTEDLDFK